MGYQALLFCGDEKTARLVTQVLTELEFSVEPANEPFAAVKRLTTQHFDAVVVDCDNEQNASLLFKSARNSGPNRTSLAVAVVEGQPGIAKAFRIGANLVLTKPINVEQSKGTLRVARGLLKKSENAKNAAAAAQASAPSAPTTGFSRPLTPAPPKPVVPPRSFSTPPAPIVRPEATSALELDADPTPLPEPADAALLESMRAPAAPPAPQAITPKLTPKSAPWTPPGRSFGSSAGEGAAVAPAREATPLASALDPEPAFTQAARPARRQEETFTPRSEPHVAEAHTPAVAAPEKSGGSKTHLIIAAVVVIAAAAGYFGWTKLQLKSSAPAQAAPVSSASATAPTTIAVTPQNTTAAVPAPAQPSATAEIPAQHQAEEAAEPEVVQKPVATKVPAEKPHESLVVKSTKSTPVEAPQAIPVIGIASDSGNKAISGLMESGGAARTPVLRTMKVSQGVSQGLILKKVAPDYPMQARQLRIEGAVQLEATIAKDGKVSAVKVLGGHPILARAATDAVKQWKYKPYLLNGQPVEIDTQITVNFKLP